MLLLMARCTFRIGVVVFYVFLCLPLNEGYSNSGFLYQPCNMTLYEGENAKLNCTPTQRSGLIATWIINGKRHYWTDFMATPAFSFDLYDNSLTINNASLDLDGSSFQCVIDRRPSRIAYLTVLYNPLDTSTFTLQLQQTIVAAPGVSTSTTNLKSSITANPTTPIGLGLDLKTRRNPLIAVSAGITCLIVAMIIVLLTVIILIVLIIQRSTKESETFTMDKNELYGQLNRKHTLVSLTRNQLYEHRNSYLSSSTFFFAWGLSQRRPNSQM